MTYNEMTKLIGDPVITLDVDDIFLITDTMTTASAQYDDDAMKTIDILVKKIEQQFDAWKARAKGIAKVK